MPTLVNPRHEQFCINRASGEDQYDSYVNAGFEGNPSAASQLAKRPEVQDRIQELIALNAEAQRESEEDDDGTTPDKAWIIKMLKKNVAGAQASGQISAANKGIELMMDLVGLTKKSKFTAAEDKAAEEEKKSEPGVFKDAGMEKALAKLEEIRRVKAAEAEAS